MTTNAVKKMKMSIRSDKVRNDATSHTVNTVQQFSKPGTAPTDKMTTTGTGGLTMMMDQVTGSRNSNDVDTSQPDQVPDVRKMEVCEV